MSDNTKAERKWLKMQVNHKTNLINGIDTNTIQTTVKAIKNNSELAQCRFHVTNKWINGGHNRTTVSSFFGAGQEIQHLQKFEIDADEPPILAGHDLAANPVEHLLNALAACLTTSIVCHAAVQGIRIDQIQSQLEGDLDMHGFLGLNTDVRKGYSNIRVNFKVKTDDQNLEKLKELTKFSPVFEVVSNGTSVDIQIEKMQD